MLIRHRARAPSSRCAPTRTKWIATILLPNETARDGTGCEAPGTSRAADHLWDMSSAPARGCRWHVPARRAPTPGGSGRSDDPLLGRLTQQQTKDQFPVLLEYAKASFEGIKQRLRHL